MYLGTAARPVQTSERYRLLRSRDGGASWDTIEETGRACITNLTNLQAHPLDAQRIFRSARCIGGAAGLGGLVESRDQGGSWTRLYDRPDNAVRRLVGGSGVVPTRFYLVMQDIHTASTTLLRSDDDAASWSEATPPWSSLTLPPETERTAVVALDADPAAPDRVFAAVSIHQSNRTPGVKSFLFSRVMASTDGGATWTDLGWSGDADINDLKLGIDGKNLYISTAESVWRLPLGGG